MDQTCSEDNRIDKEEFCHMVAYVFNKSKVSQDTFATDTWRAVINSFGHGRKHMPPILLTIWRLGFRIAS